MTKKSTTILVSGIAATTGIVFGIFKLLKFLTFNSLKKKTYQNDSEVYNESETYNPDDF